jgi:hypothetical protein
MQESYTQFSESLGGKADDSLKNFRFTLKSPHNTQARIFALKTERKTRAIECNDVYSPLFPGGICVSDNCKANTRSYTSCFGDVYNNITGLDGKTFLTGSGCFQVEEIEVFEITD